MKEVLIHSLDELLDHVKSLAESHSVYERFEKDLKKALRGIEHYEIHGCDTIDSVTYHLIIRTRVGIVINFQTKNDRIENVTVTKKRKSE